MLAEGEPAPAFSLLDDTGTTISSADYAGRRLLVYFYPRAFTPGCTTEACDLRDRDRDFRDAGWSIVGISPDLPERLARFREKHRLTFLPSSPIPTIGSPRPSAPGASRRATAGNPGG